MLCYVSDFIATKNFVIFLWLVILLKSMINEPGKGPNIQSFSAEYKTKKIREVLT